MSMLTVDPTALITAATPVLLVVAALIAVWTILVVAAFVVVTRE
jgi:hypothetical protein